MNKIESIAKASKSKSFRELNPQLFNENHPKSKDQGQAAKLESDLKHEPLEASRVQKKAKSYLVTVENARKRLLDEDNLCEKYLVDLLRYSGWLATDSGYQAHIVTRQRKVKEGEEENVEVNVYEV